MPSWMIRNKIIAFCLFSLTSVMVYGQSDFISQLRGFYDGTESITADFVQVKVDPLLEGDITTTGVFYYSKPESIRWEEMAPHHKYFILSSEGLTQWENGEYSRGSSIQERILRDFILGMIDGSLLTSEQFEIEESVEGPLTKLTLVPTDRRIARRISNVHLYFNTQTLFLSKLVLNEANSASTQIEFKEQERNIQLSADLFKSL